MRVPELEKLVAFQKAKIKELQKLEVEIIQKELEEKQKRE